MALVGCNGDSCWQISAIDSLAPFFAHPFIHVLPGKSFGIRGLLVRFGGLYIGMGLAAEQILAWDGSSWALLVPGFREEWTPVRLVPYNVLATDDCDNDGIAEITVYPIVRPPSEPLGPPWPQKTFKYDPKASKFVDFTERLAKLHR